MISITDNIIKFGNCVYTLSNTLHLYWTTEEHLRLDKRTRKNLKNTVKNIERLSSVITEYYSSAPELDDNYNIYSKIYILWKEIEITYIFKKLL